MNRFRRARGTAEATLSARVAVLHAEIARLEAAQVPATEAVDSGVPTDTLVSHLRANMVAEELAHKRAERDLLLARLAPPAAAPTPAVLAAPEASPRVASPGLGLRSFAWLLLGGLLELAMLGMALGLALGWWGLRAAP
jgi:hypothetical protein